MPARAGLRLLQLGWNGRPDPAVADHRPVAVRNVPPFDDLHAVDLLWTVDDLVQQQRLLPGELRPLLALMNTRAVITATDDDDALSGALAPESRGPRARDAGWTPATGTQLWAGQTFLRAPNTARRSPAPSAGSALRPPRAGDRQDRAGCGAHDRRRIRRGDRRHRLAARAPDGVPLFYAGDESAATIRRPAAAGAEVFITDSNRRRVFVASRMLQNYGWTVLGSRRVRLRRGAARIRSRPWERRPDRRGVRGRS